MVYWPRGQFSSMVYRTAYPWYIELWYFDPPHLVNMRGFNLPYGVQNTLSLSLTEFDPRIKIPGVNLSICYLQLVHSSFLCTWFLFPGQPLLSLLQEYPQFQTCMLPPKKTNNINMNAFKFMVLRETLTKCLYAKTQPKGDEHGQVCRIISTNIEFTSDTV